MWPGFSCAQALYSLAAHCAAPTGDFIHDGMYTHDWDELVAGPANSYSVAQVGCPAEARACACSLGARSTNRTTATATVGCFLLLQGINVELNMPLAIAYGNHDFKVKCDKRHPKTPRHLTERLYRHYFGARPLREARVVR